MEHLFKLKKDGKTVGYLKINPEGKWDELHPMEDKFMFRPTGEAHKDKWYCIGYKCLDFDSLHPFVTKDKNGKDVFAGDKVQSKDGLRKYIVSWNDRQCKWFLWGIGETWAVNEPVWKDYEIIEDKEND